jgi:hypothetical protein
METLPKRRIWLPSPGFLVLLVVLILMVTAIVIPGLLASQRASNERTASTMLKTLTSAEADFRANDRDGNQVNDFWTGDVSGLYYVRNPVTKSEVQLIQADLANADAKPLFPVSQRDHSGYFFLAMDTDDSAPESEQYYKLDTDKSGRKVHHPSKFGFSTHPKDAGAGQRSFFVNENNTIFREKREKPRTDYPDDRELMSVSACRDDD